MNVMRQYMGLTSPVYPVPRSVQQTIPICRISEEGIFQVEPEKGGPEGMQRYDKAYLFLDTNYVTKNAEEREDFQKLYVSFLNSLNVSYKILIINGQRDLKKMEQEILLKDKSGQYGEIADAYNELIQEKLLKGQCGIEQFRVFVITCERHTFTDAADFFRTIESSLEMNFRKLSSGLIPLKAKERLRILHNIYRLGKEEAFSFDYLDAVKHARDFRNDICPSAICDNKDQYGRPDGKSLMIDEQFIRILYAKEFPSALSSEFLSQLSEVSFPCILTMDFAPVPQKAARKRLYNLYMQNGNAISREQEAHNRNGNYGADISFDKRREQEKIELALNLISDNNEKMSYFGLYLEVTGSTYEELENHALALSTIAEGAGVELIPAMYHQLEAFQTCLPVGVRYCRYMRTVFSSNLAAFLPFHVAELYEPGGLFYGVNALSKNPVIGNRKHLTNGNGVICGTTGSGKSLKAKTEIGEVLVHTRDDVLVIDPHNEYESLCTSFRGAFVNIGKVGKIHVNPLDTSSFGYYETSQAFLYDKVSLMQTVISQMMERDLTSEQKSIVVGVTEAVYQPFLNAKIKKCAPVMEEFYQELLKRKEPEARGIQLGVERFLSDALDVFNGQSNVDVSNRFVVYGLSELGESLFGVGMTVMLEEIRNRIARNFKKGIATWLYVDELHVLAKFEQSAQYLDKIWREVRKMGGLVTGIDQKFSEMLENKTVETMLSNSSYITLLGQADAEIAYIQRIMDLNENEIDLIRQAVPGCGLTKWGDKIIPTEFILPKENLLYQMYNTNFHEIHKKPKKKAILHAALNLERDTRKELGQNGG